MVGKVYKMKCPRCKEDVTMEDHSSVGGPKEYWVCHNCGQEEIMFVGKSWIHEEAVWQHKYDELEKEIDDFKGTKVEKSKRFSPRLKQLLKDRLPIMLKSEIE